MGLLTNNRLKDPVVLLLLFAVVSFIANFLLIFSGVNDTQKAIEVQLEISKYSALITNQFWLVIAAALTFFIFNKINSLTERYYRPEIRGRKPWRRALKILSMEVFAVIVIVILHVLINWATSIIENLSKNAFSSIVVFFAIECTERLPIRCYLTVPAQFGAIALAFAIATLLIRQGRKKTPS